MNKDCIELAIKRGDEMIGLTVNRGRNLRVGLMIRRAGSMIASLWRGWRTRKIEQRFRCKLIDRLHRLTPKQKAIIHGAGMALDPLPDRPLSAEAREARRLPAPTLLLQAEQDRPDLPAKARVVRAARGSK